MKPRKIIMLILFAGLALSVLPAGEGLAQEPSPDCVVMVVSYRGIFLLSHADGFYLKITF